MKEMDQDNYFIIDNLILLDTMIYCVKILD